MGSSRGTAPEGFERVTAVLPEHQAFIVKKWEADAKCSYRLNFDPPCRLKFDPGTAAAI
jgi:hypothetical protein